MAEYKYSAFISYSSKDKAWAARLHRDLEQLVGKGKVFLDADRLEAGKPWNKQLMDGLTNSEHIIVFYSDNADNSKWVQHEMSTFNMLAGENFGKTRRLLCIMTREGLGTIYTEIQNVKGLIEAGIYEKYSAETLADKSLSTWQKIVGELVSGLQSNAEPLPLALVTMNAAEANELSWEQQDQGEVLGTLGTFAKEFGILNLEALRKLYGPTREDWKPFGSKDSIEIHLQQVLAGINGWTSSRKFSWDRVEFLAPGMKDEAVDVEINRLARPSVVLIDPLSLYHKRVASRVSRLKNIFARDDVVFLTLSPFCIGSAYHNLRTLVRTLTKPLLDEFFDPKPAKTTAVCNIGISDLEDLRRTILYAMSRGAARPPTVTSPFLGPRASS